MDYESFKSAWTYHLAESHLPIIGWPDESVNLRSMSRTYRVYVEPLRRGDAEPFHTAATLEWTWSALQAARGETSDGDVCDELLGRRTKLRTGKPWLRVDVTLNASLMDTQHLPMPSPLALRAWATEAIGRLDTIERLIPEKNLRARKGKLIEVLAWRGEPELEVRCDADGELRLTGVKVASWQAITLPRSVEEPGEPGPDKQLRRLFKRLVRSLTAWSEVMDHLR